MYLEKRPTAVSVIGWAWIVLGVLLALSVLASAGMALGAFLQLPAWWVAAYVGQLAASGVAIIAGVSFLRLRAWSRPVLEVLTWLLLVFTVGFMIYWLHGWLAISLLADERNFSIVGAAMGVCILVVYAVPLIAMLRSLRGAKLRGVFA